MYELESENLENLGGPMGSEYTFPNWRKFFTTAEQAKKYAEKDYRGKIEWIKEDSGWRSPDLNYVMYHIRLMIPEPTDASA